MDDEYGMYGMLCHDRCILGLCARCMFRIDLVCVCVGGGGGMLIRRLFDRIRIWNTMSGG